MEIDVNNLLNGGLSVGLCLAIISWIQQSKGRKSDREYQNNQELKRNDFLRSEENRKWKRDECVKSYLEYRRLLAQLIFQEESPGYYEKDRSLLLSVRNSESALEFLMPELGEAPGRITNQVLTLREADEQNADKTIADRIILHRVGKITKDLKHLDGLVKNVLDQNS